MSESNELRNRYHLMRHGQSRPNQAGIIVSKPENGVKSEHGLTEYGREEVRQSAMASELSARAIIYASPFSRTVQSAAILAEVIGANDIHVNRLLRERDFGKWELTSTSNYERAWEADEILSNETIWDSRLRQWQVEFPAAVGIRVCRAVAMAESNYRGEDIVFVSHGDTSQIAEAVFNGLPAHRHREVPHLQTAEIRHLNPTRQPVSLE